MFTLFIIRFFHMFNMKACLNRIIDLINNIFRFLYLYDIIQVVLNSLPRYVFFMFLMCIMILFKKFLTLLFYLLIFLLLIIQDSFKKCDLYSGFTYIIQNFQSIKYLIRSLFVINLKDPTYCPTPLRSPIVITQFVCPPVCLFVSVDIFNLN